MSFRPRRSRISPHSSATSLRISVRASRTSTLKRPTIHAAAIRWRPLLTENVHPQILVGYGDPAVLKTEDGLVARRDLQ